MGRPYVTMIHHARQCRSVPIALPWPQFAVQMGDAYDTSFRNISDAIFFPVVPGPIDYAVNGGLRG